MILLDAPELLDVLQDMWMARNYGRKAGRGKTE
jgi:hypothetical protein